MEENIKISKTNYVRAALNVANCFLNLTPIEMDIISTMLNHGAITITAASRKLLINSLNKSKYVISNNIKRMKHKAVLIQDNNKTVVHPKILSYIQTKEFIVKFEINEDNDS
jgi:predicted transcriptional regulator